MSEADEYRRLIDELLSKIEVRSMEECAKADLIVCGDASHFPDDVAAACFRCGNAVYHRPYMPAGPRKVCMACASKVVEEESTADADH